MEDRTDLPRIKPRRQPSIFNEGMADGMWTGWLFGSWGFLFNPHKGTGRAWLAIEAVCVGIGGLWGGLEGKHKQEKEQREGRIVSNPTFLNLGLLNGAVVAYLGTLAAQFFPLHIPEAPTVTVLGYLGCMAVGSIMRHNVLKQDFDDAVRKQHDELLAQRAKEQVPTLGTAPTILLQESVEPAPKHSHAERLQLAEAQHSERAV